MWKVNGETIPISKFTPFEAGEVLYDFDFPRILTLDQREDGPYLACWSDGDGLLDRYIVVPTSSRILLDLKSGRCSLREALNQSRCWICDVNQDGKVVTSWRVDLERIPDDAMPAPGTLLWAGLEENPIDWEGRIRELDKDCLMFDLRDMSGLSDSKRFVFSEELLEEVLRALGDDAKVRVIGRNLLNRDLAQALSLTRLPHSSSDAGG